MTQSKPSYFPRLFEAALLCGVLICAGCGEGASVEELLADAKQQQQKGDHRTALIYLRNAVLKAPGNPEARYLLGSTLLQTGNVRAAEEELRAALHVGADPLRIIPELARALLLQGKLEEALHETSAANVPQAQQSPEILHARGLAQHAAGQLADARQTLNEALILRPDFTEAMLTQGRVAIAARDWKRAEALVDKALELAPTSEDGWRFKGELQRVLGRQDRSIEAYSKAVETNPRSTAARLDLAAVQIAAGRFDEAVQQLDAVRLIAPQHAMAAYFQALLEFRRKNYAAALISAQEALKASPQHLPSLLLAGAVEYERGNVEDAESHLNAVLRQAPGNLHARKLMAANQIKNRQYVLAIRTLGPALETRVADPDLYALAAEAHLRNNQYTRATQFFEIAASIDRKNSSWRAGAGLSRMVAGDTEKAIAELEAAAALDTADGHRVEVLLAMSYIQRGEFDRALKAVAKLAERRPRDPLYENLKGAALLGKRDTAQARVHFENALKLQPTYFPAVANLAGLDLVEGDPKAARRRYEGVLEKSRDKVPAMLALADLASHVSGNEKEVLDWISRAKQANPNAPEPFATEVGYYLRTGQGDRALAATRELQARRPNNPEVLDLVGQALLASGQPNEALHAYSKLTSLQPDSAFSLFRLASAQMASQKRVAAGQSLRRALQLRPGYREAQAMLVALELEQGHNREALQVAKQIQSEAPSDPTGYMLEGDVRLAEKETPRAVALYEKAYALGKSPLLAMKIHHAWGTLGKPEQGEQRLTEWLRQNPGDSVARLYLADYEMRQGRYAAAIVHYRVVLERQPGNVSALNNIAWSLHNNKDPAALNYAEEAYRLAPADPLIGDTLGWILVATGNTHRGLELLRTAAGAAASNREIGYHFAVALTKTGNRGEAVKELERILTPGAEFPQQAEAVALLKSLRGR